MKQIETDLNKFILNTDKYLYYLYKEELPDINIKKIKEKYPNICSIYKNTFEEYINVYAYLNILEKLSNSQINTFKSFLFKYNNIYDINHSIDLFVNTKEKILILIFSIQYFFI